MAHCRALYGFVIAAALGAITSCSDVVQPRATVDATPVDESRTEAIITAQKAIELASVFLREFGPYNRFVIETGFQATIRFDELKADDKVHFAESPYRDPDAHFDGATRKAIGPYYIVNFKQGEKTAVAVAVSAFSTDVGIKNRRLVLPRISGNEFRFIGVRANHEFPLSSSRAMGIVSERTEASVVGTPILVRPGYRDWSPLYSRWRVTLDRPVLVRTADRPSREILTDVVYVDQRGGLVVQRPDEPGALSVRTIAAPSGAGRSLLVLPRRGLSSSFASVATVNGEKR